MRRVAARFRLAIDQIMPVMMVSTRFIVNEMEF